MSKKTKTVLLTIRVTTKLLDLDPNELAAVVDRLIHRGVKGVMNIEDSGADPDIHKVLSLKIEDAKAGY